MACFVVSLNEIERGLSTTAAHWLARFYPTVDVEVTEQQITLTATQLNEPQLRKIWTTALFNELACAEAADRRRRVLGGLLR